MSSSRFGMQDQVEVRTATETSRDAFGPNEAESKSKLLWCMIIQLKPGSVAVKDGVQKVTNPTYKLKIPGRHAFSFEDTTFRWVNRDDMILRPTGAPTFPGRRRENWTVLEVEDITGRAEPAQP